MRSSSSSETGSLFTGSVSAVAAHEDLVAFGSGTKKVSVGRVSHGAFKVEAEFEDNKGEVIALAFTSAGDLLAAGDVSDNENE